MPLLQVGQTVTVYFDPLRCEEPEADAVLLTYLGRVKKGLEVWTLVFVHAGHEHYERVINPKAPRFSWPHPEPVHREMKISTEIWISRI